MSLSNQASDADSATVYDLIQTNAVVVKDCDVAAMGLGIADESAVDVDESLRQEEAGA
jgi:hypothetical protein